MDWDDLLTEFRALGGTADNIRLGQGALGRGLFAIEPNRPVHVQVPENLLADSDEVVFENGALKLAPHAKIGAREREFLESYHAHFSWGGGGGAEIEAVLDAARELPEDLRRELASEHRCGRWFEDYSPTLVEQQFLASRRIAYKNRTVLMPVLDLANHGSGAEFETANGILLECVAPGEVLVRYSDTDSYGMFLSWGFAAEQKQALSLELSGQIEIAREFGAGKADKRPWIPDIAVAGECAKLNFLMLGNRSYPRLPRGIFRRVMRDAGFAVADESFDVVQHINRTHFLALLRAVEDLEGAMALTLRRMARHQLAALSFCLGAREI